MIFNGLFYKNEHKHSQAQLWKKGNFIIEENEAVSTNMSP
jgi:hypothetical protein